MQVIQNNDLRLEINERGGTLHSVFDKVRNCEMLWQGDAKSWAGQDVIIFPFIARLKDKFYTVDNQQYFMDSHGLLRTYTFEVAEHSETALTLKAHSTQETRERYPFDFDFTLTYVLTGNEFTVAFKVFNCDQKTIYFGLGGHPAYIVDGIETPEGTDTSGNKIVFSSKQNLVNYYLDSDGCFITHKGDFGSFDELDFDKSLMKQYKTLIFEGIDAKYVTIQRKNGRKIQFECHQPPILAFWSHQDFGNYICVEPWWGLPDFAVPVRELKDKEHIQSLDSGKTFFYQYTTKII